MASNHSSSNYYVSTRVGRPLNIRGARLETLVLASENGAETVSVIHQDLSASRKINISCANERWPSLGAKERSVKNGGGRGGGREKNGGKIEEGEKNVRNRRNGNIGRRNIGSPSAEIIYVIVHCGL